MTSTRWVPHAIGYLACVLGALVAASATAATVSLPEVQVESRARLEPGLTVAVELAESGGGFTVGLYPSARSECGLSLDAAARTIRGILTKGSLVDRALAQLDPNAEGRLPEEIVRRDIMILVASLGQGREYYSSFFIEKMPGLKRPTIILDCDSIARRYWEPELAHELAHAWNFARGLPPWTNEMIAQLVEADAGGARPERSLERFHAELSVAEAGTDPRPIPPLLTQSRLPESSKAYAFNYLFGKYLLTRWGGWETLRAMIAPVDSTSSASAAQKACAKLSTSFERMTCLGGLSLAARGFEKKLVDRMTAQGLLRYFAIATILNSPLERLYSIPRWSGMGAQAAREPHPGTMLEPGQFWFAPVKREDETGQRFNANLEVYRVRYSSSKFRIIPREKGPDANPEGQEWPEEMMLILNTGSTPRPVY